MDLKKETIEELKSKHGEIRKSTISFFDENNKLHEVELVFKKPKVVNLERFQKTSEKSPSSAQLELMRSLVVYPEGAVSQLENYPAAIASFVENEVSPFFGKDVRTDSVVL